MMICKWPDLNVFYFFSQEIAVTYEPSLFYDVSSFAFYGGKLAVTDFETFLWFCRRIIRLK